MAKQGAKQSNPRELSIAMGSTGVLAASVCTKIASASSPEDKMAMRIHSIEYFMAQITTGLVTFGASLDNFKFGFSFLSAQPAGGFLPDSPGVIDFNVISRIDMGTAATGNLFKDPFIVRNMHDRHPDGFLVHPSALYYWSYVDNAMASAFVYYAKIWYTMEEITQDMWDDMWKQIFVTQAG
jgi:hypothetical protein